MPPLILILNNIRSAYNVGAIFRTADAVGVKEIYLVGYTPAPLDRFGRPVKQIAKTALGAEQTIPWTKAATVGEVIVKLQAAGYRIIALEQSVQSADYRQVKLIGPTAVILGNEVDGLPAQLLKDCDVVAQIAMRGKKESLNVSVAAGIFLFALTADN